jgi:hypothetical protein
MLQRRGTLRCQYQNEAIVCSNTTAATQQMQMQHTEQNFRSNEPEGEGIADHFDCRPEQDAPHAPQ